MGVYIKSMEMPEIGTYEVSIDSANGKDKTIMSMFVRGSGGLICCGVYEIVPVPPHGRLIDADKQDAQIEALIERHLHGYTKSTWDFVCELRDILKRNRTIIPAEDEHTMEEFMYGQEGNPNDGSV